MNLFSGGWGRKNSSNVFLFSKILSMIRHRITSSFNLTSVKNNSLPLRLSLPVGPMHVPIISCSRLKSTRLYGSFYFDWLLRLGWYQLFDVLLPLVSSRNHVVSMSASPPSLIQPHLSDSLQALMFSIVRLFILWLIFSGTYGRLIYNKIHLQPSACLLEAIHRAVTSV